MKKRFTFTHFSLCLFALLITGSWYFVIVVDGASLLSLFTAENLQYASPVQANAFEGLPPAYIETAEFDCLHDDGILYEELLKNAGVETELYETKGTMHGYDIVLKAPLTKEMIAKRADYMRRMFSGN